MPPSAITLNALNIASVAAPSFRLLKMHLYVRVYDKAFADFAMSNLGISIATNASAKQSLKGTLLSTMNIS